MKISARNCIEGKVIAMHEGPVSTEVTIETPAGEKIVASITTTCSTRNRLAAASVSAGLSLPSASLIAQ